MWAQQHDEAETSFLYSEIFERKVYLRGGVSLDGARCVLDVGANIGLFSLFAHSESPGTRIYAFEPIAPIYALLACNLYANSLNATPLCLAIGERTGPVDLQYYPGSSLTSGRATPPEQVAEVTRRHVEHNLPELSDALDLILERKTVAQTHSCRMTSLCQVLSEIPESTIDLLKIDVEGSELAVLDGIGDDVAWGKIRQVVLEIDEKSGLHVAVERLTARGFQVLVEQDELLRTTGLHYVYARRPILESEAR
jgi:FkbM family methyltransferase